MGVTAECESAAVENVAGVGASLIQAQVIQGQSRSGCPVNRVAVEHPLVAQRGSAGRGHSESGAVTANADGICGLSNTGNRNGAGSGCAGRFGGSAPVCRIIAI